MSLLLNQLGEQMPQDLHMPSQSAGALKSPMNFKSKAVVSSHFTIHYTLGWNVGQEYETVILIDI